MKRFAWMFAVLFVLRWQTQEARPNDMGSVTDAMIHIPGCHIETTQKEERFGDEMKAHGRMAALETDGVKVTMFKVTEEPVKINGESKP